MTADYNWGDSMLMTSCDELHVALLVVGHTAILQSQRLTADGTRLIHKRRLVKQSTLVIASLVNWVKDCDRCLCTAAYLASLYDTLARFSKYWYRKKMCSFETDVLVLMLLSLQQVYPTIIFDVDISSFSNKVLHYALLAFPNCYM